MTTKVTFQLPASYAANASEGIILGEFNNWNPERAIPLQRHEDGSLVAEVDLAVGKTYQYRYFLSDGRWVNDNSNTTWVELYGGYVENCVVEVPLPVTEPGKESIKPLIKKTTTRKTNAKEKPVQDDLSLINGITKKLAALLYKENIHTYKDLSKSTVKNLKQLLANAGENYTVVDPSTWPKQAKLAAAGNWEEVNTFKTAVKRTRQQKS